MGGKNQRRELRELEERKKKNFFLLRMIFSTRDEKHFYRLSKLSPITHL